MAPGTSRSGLAWEQLDDSKASRIAVHLENADPGDRGAWRRYRTWAIESLGRFMTALPPILAAVGPLSSVAPSMPGSSGPR